MAAAFFRRQGVNLKEYWKNVMNDYRTVATETASEARAKPMKTVTVGAVLAGLTYMYKTNPGEWEMHNELAELRQQMSLVPNPVHNKGTDAALFERTTLFNQNRLTYYNLWFFSFLVRSEHDNSVRQYSTQDKSLNGWSAKEFFKNVHDIGCFGKWWHLEDAFRDYDINTDEFNEQQLVKA